MYERILFVCTGNTCRSPMAEAMFRELAAQEGLVCQVRSAGVSAMDGSPISKYSADILLSKGISDRLQSSMLNEQTAAWADLILTMTASHKQVLLSRYPEAADKVFTLKEFAEDDPRAEALLKEWQALQAELQIKQALGQPITDEELRRVEQIQQRLPELDISDPFGGSKSEYERCADEIERYLRKLIQKLRP